MRRAKIAQQFDNESMDILNCTCTDVIGVTEQIWRVDKISVLLTLDCRISAIEDLSHKSLESRTRSSVNFRTN